MTQEDKELLLRDLCARLPFGVILRDDYGELTNVNVYNAHIEHLIDRVSAGLEKMMLRPLSSMTKEEKSIYSNYRRVVRGLGLMFEYNMDFTIEWLLQHHFDYRGLIEKGLALEAPEGMYK